MGRKFLSIVMPIRNIDRWEKNIIQNVNLVNEKNEDDVEILFIYSQKMDSSVVKLKQKLFNKKNIKFIKDQQTGIYSAMNKGIFVSNGEFIQFMGSDDTFNKKNFKKIINFLKKNSNTGILLCEAILSTDNINEKKSGNKLACGRGGRIHWLLSSPRIHQAMIYNNRVIKKYQLKFLTSLKVTSDYIFTAELLSLNYNIKKLDLWLVSYYKYGFSSNSSVISNYLEHIKGFAQSKYLKKYLLIVIFLRFGMLFKRGLKKFIYPLYKYLKKTFVSYSSN